MKKCTITAQMANILDYIANSGDDTSVLFLSVVEPCNRQLKGLFNRNLIEVKTITHPAGSMHPDSEEWHENYFVATAAGLEELKNWQFEDEPNHEPNSRRMDWPR